MATSNRQRDDNWVRVFISHKEEDKTLALAVRQILENKCNNLRCFVSGAVYSHDWLATIKSELAAADVLLLLFTSPAKQWDWPLYEVGLFTPLDDQAPGHAIVYLYAGEHRPAPLEHLQGVRVDPSKIDNLEKFLAQFYKTSEITGREPSLLPRISAKEISSRAAEISRAFMTETAVQLYPTYRLVLGASAKSKDGVSITSSSIPRDCCVEQVTPPTLSIFGFSESPKTWGDLLDSIVDDSDWKHELDVQFQRATTSRVAYPTPSTFRGLEDSSNFRAMITRLERAETRIIRTVIAFIPEHTPATVGGPAFNLLRVATRFQTEVIAQFCGELERLSAKVGGQRAFSRLIGAIRSIERESEELRFMDVATVCSVFSEDKDDRTTVKKMFKDWKPTRDRIFICAEKMDICEMEGLLSELKLSNTRFLRMIARRHCELIEKDAGAVLKD